MAGRSDHATAAKNLRFLPALLGAALFLSLTACGEDKPRFPELETALRVVRPIIEHHPIMVSAGDFQPNEVPSDFIQWFFSPFGSALWVPPSLLEFSAEELNMIRKSSGPLLPETVSLVANEPDKNHGKQLVLVPDDSRGLIILQGFLNPQQDPVLIEEIQRPSFQKYKG